MARFFIDRPIFAWVIAIVVMLAGILAVNTLPIAQYPAIASPQVAITATYPGASAKTLEDTVTQVIEQNMKGLDHLSYISSTSDSSGSVTVTLTFENGTDPDIAQVQVQNKLSLATPSLPQTVQQLGLTVAKSARNFLTVLGFVSQDGRMSGADLADYVAANVQDPISRVPGVGDTQLFGAAYAMRIWLDPDKLNNFKLTAGDVKSAIQAQNVQVSAGQLGALPSRPGQQLNATITAQSLLKTAEEFERIQLRTQSDGSEVRLHDVARIELGSDNYNVISRFNGQPATGLAIKLAAGANALETVKAVRTELDKLGKSFPPGMTVVSPYDTTPFVRLSIEDVVKTLVEAVVLVFLVMYLFLQNFRATLIPTIAVPVVLLGTFGVLAAFGYSINTLTMFAMVLAIGLLVDDAIVVVENVERVMAEEGLSPKEATRKSMDQITGALVGVALVLAAVFVPMAFFGGSTGVIYRQFSVTIVSAMTLSVLVALILTPALCATLLKPVPHDAKDAKGGGHGKRGFFGWFNRGFTSATNGYRRGVNVMIKRSLVFVVIYLVIAGAMVFLYTKMPSGFLPDEDQGIIFTQIQLPAGATQERTLEVVKQVEHHFLVDQKDAVTSAFAVVGFSFGGTGQNTSIIFVSLKPWDKRTKPELKASAVARRAMQAFGGIRDAQVFAFTPPAVSELGNANGFDFQLKDTGGVGHEALMQARNQFLGMAAQNKSLVAVRPNGQDDTPVFQLDIDSEKAGSLRVALSDINDTLATAFGSTYVNQFVDRGRIKKVYLQADVPFRMEPQDLDRWYVRSANGSMVPFSAFATSRWSYGSPRLERYNGVPSVEILGMPMFGTSSGAAIKAVEQIASKLPAGIGYEWTGLSLQEQQSGSQAPLLYAISLLIVFLCLAALYESWAIPVSVMLVVPLGIIGAIVASMLRWQMNDVYFQVGLLTTVGLAAKNAILIVEFARELQEQGKSLIESALEAARMRLRPIVMTSLAFILGVLPMALSSGAGSGAQNALGTAVMGGMLSATLLAIFFVPVFFVLVRRVFKAKPASPPVPAHAQPANPQPI